MQSARVIGIALAMLAGMIASPAESRTSVGVGIGVGVPLYPPPPPYYYPPYYAPPPPYYYYPPPQPYYAPPPPVAGAAPASPPAATAGQECREYRTTTTIDGKTQEIFGTACLQPDGRWRIIN